VSNAPAQLRAHISIASAASHHSSPVRCSAPLGGRDWITGHQDPKGQRLQMRASAALARHQAVLVPASRR
jgi:hypothetical protein